MKKNLKKLFWNAVSIFGAALAISGVIGGAFSISKWLGYITMGILMYTIGKEDDNEPEDYSECPNEE